MRINGNLVFNADATGEIQYAYIERISAAPTFNSAEKGRIYFNTTTALYYFNDGTAWQPFATGGNAALVAQYLNNLLASVGDAVTATGTWNGSTAFSGDPILAGATSITNALTLLSTASYGHDQLSELVDVTLGSLSNNQFLTYNLGSGKWNNHTLVLADVTDVTASATEVNVLTGKTFSTTEINYVTGVTSSIQTQLNNKQPLDSTLTGLAALSGTGIVVETSADVFTNRTLVAPAAGLTISDADGIAGNPTFVLANDLAAFEGLTTTGYVVRTGDGTATTRSITGTVGNIDVTNGSGVSSDTSIDLATVSQAATGTFSKVTIDSFGRVTGNTAVTTADITGLVDTTYVNATGDTMTGSLVMATGTHLTLTDTAVNATDAVNKAYVDALAQSLSWKDAVKAATTTNINVVTGGLLTVDSIVLAAGDRVLVKNQTAPAENGIYVVAAGAWVRATDMDAPLEFEGATVLVKEGTTQADFGYTQTNVVTTIGTSAVNFVQFTGSSVLTAGTGLYQVANVLNVALGAGIAELPTAEVGLDIYNSAGGNLALILTTDGTTHSTATGAQLHLLLDTGSGLTQTITGLKIDTAGVTNAMLANPSVTLNSDGGTATLALGGTLEIKGTSTQGIVTSNSGSSVTITASDASSSQKGVASFVSPTFAVTTGSVDIATAGVTNTMLANSTVTITGDTGTSSLALGASFQWKGESTSGTSVAVTSGVATVSVRAATASLLGVASFSATDFLSTAGAITLVAKSLNSLTDVATASAVSGQALVYNNATSKFVNESIYFLYTGTASTSHTVTHNLGQKYCNVTVVDSTDEVVIPQSITFNSASQLTVTFTSSISCKVVVMGVNLQ